MTSPADQLRALLAQPRLHTMPCAYDALSAKLVEQAGFPLTFMTGFGASASRIGAPDLGLMSYGEVVDHARNIAGAVSIPMIGDGDTGYGNAMNVRRTVAGMASAGCAAVMIEDQLAPKRCGHTPGKAVVGREEAYDRIRAAVDARESGADILILARTDARHEHGLAEALTRAQRFRELGADILFVEAPRSEAEMREICAATDAPNMANIVEGGETPDLSREVLQDIGYRIAAYPLTLMSAAMRAMVQTLEQLAKDQPRDGLMDFADLRQRIGFDDYYAASEIYTSSARTVKEPH
ncbi:isocitrate lyase/PEP mutase family protein [Parasedimentitalea maritima]|uniref:Carboxyvinyl-carboxyphosphonate phosphorylmutase n=1 Tax=Parasedimentitalea maritima TaxID=2578117 RepID=A0A6A4RN43_9RHOB|nr:isocitrate lyase/PEP mutase family protein [Zongyanglinia marina]KAE9632370.1 carboxyvinyl-carboxyphosphonate phosphorylmutase [Zongyanglinia marina]